MSKDDIDWSVRNCNDPADDQMVVRAYTAHDAAVAWAKRRDEDKRRVQVRDGLIFTLEIRPAVGGVAKVFAVDYEDGAYRAAELLCVQVPPARRP